MGEERGRCQRPGDLLRRRSGESFSTSRRQSILDYWRPRAALRHNSLLLPSMSALRRSFVLRHALPRVSALAIHRPRSLVVPHLNSQSLRPSPLHTSAPRFQNAQSPASKTCPACSKPLPSPVPACTNCWSIFSLPPNVTHHEIFGLPYEPNPFIVDLSALKQRFRQAQAVCHPDTWTSKGPVSTLCSS